ncbi:hypothetical protein M153_8140002767 [Pseudoloma neurophilia]|uniref:Drug/Metabolite Transporter (DMT) Superfamily n=1 Tax=Pseudoloma neurophilia TaxID=146866 RepID=A0A0R0LVV7_9MICR|nr:hypothetical protein M153_8140002767 [Pseudoloma neurophilia]
MKKYVFLLLFVCFCVGNGLLRRKVAEDIKSFLAMIFIQGIIQLFISIIMTKKFIFFSKKIFFLVICSYIAQIINWKSNEKLRSVTHSLIEPSRVFFVTILTILIVGKTYTKLQYFSIFLIMVGIAVSSFFRENSGGQDQIGYIILLIFGCFTNALSSVSFFKFFSNGKLKFWSYIFTFSIYAVVLYTLGLFYELFLTKNFDSKKFFTNKKIYCMHLTTTLEYLGYRFIGFHTCPIEKNLVLIIINISIPIFYNIFFKYEFTISSGIALVLVYLGSLLFECKNIRNKLSRNDTALN